MNEQKERSFRGVWIPKHIWLNDDLSPLEKLFLAEIESLDNDQEKGCFASNEYFGNFFKISEGRAANIISSLRKRGFIKQVYFDGRFRGIRLHENVKAGFTEIDGRFHENVKAGFTKRGKRVSRKREHTIIVDNKVNNKEEKESVKNAFSPPFTYHGTIETDEHMEIMLHLLEAEKKEKAPPSSGPTPPAEFIVTTVEPQAPYIRIAERVEIPETPGPKSPGEKIRELCAVNHKIRETFSMVRKIPASKFDEYLTAFDAEKTGLPIPQTWKNDNDLVMNFWAWSEIRWNKERGFTHSEVRNNGRGAYLVNSGTDMSKYDKKQKF